MAEGKEYLWHLLNTAISAPNADVVNFKALRTLLEASIGHVDESQSNLAKIREKRQEIHDELKHLGDEKLVVSGGLPEEGIYDSSDPVAVKLSKVTGGRSVHNTPSIQRRENKILPGKSSGSKADSPTAEKHATHSNRPLSGSASSLNLTTSKSPRSKTESDDKIEKKGIFSHRSNIQGTSKEAMGTSKDNEMTMVVSLPRDLVCESKDATEIKLSITDSDSIVSKVSVGGGRGIKRSKSNLSDKVPVKSSISEKSHISEKWSGVNIDRHEKCEHGVHDVKKCGVTQSKSKEDCDSPQPTTGASEIKPTENAREKHVFRPGGAAHNSSSGTPTPNGTAIDQKASKESVRSRVPDKSKQEVGSSKRSTSLGLSPSDRRHIRSTSKDSKISTATVKSNASWRPHAKSASNDQHGMSSPLTGVSSMSKSESAKVPHASRDRTDFIKDIFNRHRTETESESSDDQSPRSRMKRPQIISQLKDSKTKHLPSIGEYFPDKAKRMDYIVSKLQKYKREPPESYRRSEVNHSDQMDKKKEKKEDPSKSTVVEVPVYRKNCMCRQPMNCNYDKKAKIQPYVCFCACSYIQGINAETYFNSRL